MQKKESYITMEDNGVERYKLSKLTKEERIIQPEEKNSIKTTY